MFFIKHCYSSGMSTSLLMCWWWDFAMQNRRTANNNNHIICFSAIGLSIFTYVHTYVCVFVSSDRFHHLQNQSGWLSSVRLFDLSSSSSTSKADGCQRMKIIFSMLMFFLIAIFLLSRCILIIDSIPFQLTSSSLVL